MLGKSYNYINSIEGGISFPPPAVIDQIASFLHIEPVLLFSTDACPKNLCETFLHKYGTELKTALKDSIGNEIDKICDNLTQL